MFIPRVISVAMAAAGCVGVLVSLAGFVCADGPPGADAEEFFWEVVGDFESLKPGDPETAIFKVAGGARVNVPLAALSEASRNRIAALARTPEPVPGGGAEPATAELDAALADSRTAAEAADLCRIVLARENMPEADRVAIEAMQDSWDTRALAGEVRLGAEWVSADVAAAAAARATEQIRQAGEMIRLGNLKLAADKLEEASGIDAGSGRAHFFLGLAYLLIGRPELDKAGSAFSQVVRREPANGPAWNNLAICELQRRRSATAVEAFRQADTFGADPKALATNLAFVLRVAGDRRSRISEKAVDELSKLYHRVLRDNGLAPIESTNAPILLGPDNVALMGTDAAEIGRLASGRLEPANASGFTGIVVAPGVVAVPALWLQGADQPGQFVIATPTNSAVPAKSKATLADGAIVLLECEGLDVEPVPLCGKLPDETPEMLVIPLARGTSGVPGRLRASPAEARMTSAPSGQKRRRFVYQVALDSVPVGAAIVDKAGRLVGMSAPSPKVPFRGEQRWIGVPVEEILATLGLEAVGADPPDGAEVLGADALVEQVSRATVLCSPVNPGVPLPIR